MQGVEPGLGIARTVVPSRPAPITDVAAACAVWRRCHRHATFHIVVAVPNVAVAAASALAAPAAAIAPITFPAADFRRVFLARHASLETAGLLLATLLLPKPGW